VGIASKSQSRMGESLQSIVGRHEKTAQTKAMSKKQNQQSTHNTQNQRNTTI
jgi:hypothetical protein